MELENTTNVEVSASTGPDGSDVTRGSESYLTLLWKDLQEKEDEDRKKLLGQALKEAKKFLEEDEHSWKAHQFMGKILLKTGEFEEALKHISRALAIHPGSEELRHAYKSCKSLVEVHTAEHVEPNPTTGSIPRALTMSGRYEIKDIHSKRLSFSGKKSEGEIPSRPGQEDVLEGHRLFLGLDQCPQNFEQAAHHYTKAAEVNNAEGMYCLALLNIIGKGVQKDFAKGKRLLEKAVDLTPVDDIGVIAARLYLGLIFHLGNSVDDIMQAAELYKKAMESGCDRAANNLGVLLFREIGKKRGRELAECCWKIAVHQRNKDAALSLTLLYYCEYDNLTAAKMLNKAVGHKEGGPRQVWKDHLMFRLKEKATLGEEIETFEESHGLQCDHLSFIERKRRFDKAMEELGKEPPTTDPEDDFVPELINMLVAKKPSPESWKGLSPKDPVDPATNTKPYDLKEFEERSRRGSGTAIKFLQELKERSAVSALWRKCGVGREDITPENRVALIEALYNCYIDDSFLECREPEDPNLCKFLEDMLTTHGNEKSDLDRKIRVCYGNLSEKHDPYREHIVREGLRRYPAEVPMYRLFFVLDWGMQDYVERTLENGLDYAPNDLSLLFGRAILQFIKVTRNVTTSSGAEATDFPLLKQSFQTFVNEAPEDHPLLPDVFYSMALAHYMEVDSFYKRKGLSDTKFLLDCGLKIHDYLRKAEATEKKLLFTEFPYESSFKSILTDKRFAVFRILAILKSNKWENRINLVKRHRRLVMEARSRHTKKSSLHKIQVNVNDICVDLQKLKLEAFEEGRNLKAISLEKMNLIGKHTYEGRILSLVLVEDPVWINSTPGFVQVMAKDNNGEWIRVHVHIDPEIDFERVLEFGSKFGVINPCLQQFSNGARILQVKKETSVTEDGKVDDMCRCCGQENVSSTRRCANCKWARYCSRQCQVADWKDLGHRLICDLN